jgi:5'-phosphate synthase pdxT subunit
MRVGVVAVQGAVSEHVCAFERAFEEMGVRGTAVWVRKREELEKVDALAIPGGESTTISKLLAKFGLYESIRARALEGMPVMGTCAGCILLAKEGDAQVGGTGTRLLELMDMRVSRNAFGRQRESFEAPVKVDGLEGGAFPAVFIRAPAILDVSGKCKPIATFEKKIVAARQGALLALAFHPELSGDVRLHKAFLSMP